MGNKTAKGSVFERLVSKKLSLWWSEGESDAILWRSTQSGGRATTRAKKGMKTAGSYGDLVALDEQGDPFINFFCCELKRGYSSTTDVLALLDSKQKVPTLLAHWKQCDRDRILADRPECMVIIKRDAMRICVIISQNLFSNLTRIFGTYVCDFITYRGNDCQFKILRLEEFLNWVDPKTFKEQLEFLSSKNICSL